MAFNKEDLKRRIAETKTTRWIRFGIVAAIFVGWVAWLGSWWVLIFLPLLFDIYITGYIPLTWWKKSKSNAVRSVMAWVDAIVYALVLVYFVFIYVGQNYQIPSSSLEKTLLVGDYLWVNKMAYGPRVPMTPVHFPLVHNTFPVLNTKSYLDWPQWKYHRLKGLGNVESGDIVVFNFPAGDTIAYNVQNPDYYTLVRMYGHDVVNNNKAAFGEIMYRPVDRRENYVKRAVGLPGETIEIRNGNIYINNKMQPMPENAQFNYYIQAAYPLTDLDWERLGIAEDDRHQLSVGASDVSSVRAMGFTVNEDGSVPPIYLSPLTAGMVKDMEADNAILHTLRMQPPTADMLFPEGVSDGWTRADYGPLWIPKKGATINLTPYNWKIYNRAIRNYEHHHDAYLGADDKVYIDGKPADTYTFEMDYYFMMGDNRDNSLDSRYWGFVPEDHIIGKPMRVLISFDKDKGLFNGGIRWDRMLLDANKGF